METVAPDCPQCGKNDQVTPVGHVPGQELREEWCDRCEVRFTVHQDDYDVLDD